MKPVTIAVIPNVLKKKGFTESEYKWSEEMKVGRNEICPCGSGNKYKRCCGGRVKAGMPNSPQPKPKRVTLGGAITHCQEMAKKKEVFVQQLGVFILFADTEGDAWVLEVTDSDCIKISAAGEPLEVPLEEDEKTIEVNWSHTFSFTNKKLQIKAYKDKQIDILEKAPSQQLFAVRRKILKRISPELLEQVHVEEGSI